MGSRTPLLPRGGQQARRGGAWHLPHGLLLSRGVFSIDDRPVRESERRASRLHFGSEESLDSKQSFLSVFREERYELFRKSEGESHSVMSYSL